MLHQLPPELRRLDEDNRKKFATIAAVYLIEILGDDGVLDVVRQGEQKLKSLCLHYYKPQAFQSEDIERIWVVLNYHANDLTKRKRQRVVHG